MKKIIRIEYQIEVEEWVDHVLVAKALDGLREIGGKGICLRIINEEREE